MHPHHPLYPSHPHLGELAAHFGHHKRGILLRQQGLRKPRLRERASKREGNPAEVHPLGHNLFLILVYISISEMYQKERN